jgi:hypothetical protein
MVPYALEFIHPFGDGNGRLGRLWQTLILSQWKPPFAYLPVETVIRDQQADYYKVPAACDKAGNSTALKQLAGEHDSPKAWSLERADRRDGPGYCRWRITGTSAHAAAAAIRWRSSRSAPGWKRAREPRRSRWWREVDRR